METTKTITKLTGRTVFAMPSGVLPLCATRGTSTDVARLRNVVLAAGNGLGLDGTGVSAVSGFGFTGFGGGVSVESGLSLDWAMFERLDVTRDERPTQAPKATAAAAIHGDYAQASGAGVRKQDEQLIDQAEAAPTGAEAVRMRAFRGPEPWSERT